MAEVSTVQIRVTLDHEESDRRLKNMAATATGLRLMCERLEQHLTELEARAERLAKHTVPDAARASAKAIKRG